MSLVYLDASILAAWVLDSDPEHTTAAALVNDITNGRIDAITSSVALMEVIDAIRKRITEEHPYRGDPLRRDMSVLEAEIDLEVEDFIRNILALNYHRHLIWEDPRDPFEQILEEAFSAHRGDFGHFWHGRKIVRGTPRQCYLYDGMSQWDMQHAVLAKALSATALYTFDDDFQTLSSMPTFLGTLSIMIL